MKKEIIMKNLNRPFTVERPLFLGALITIAMTGALLVTGLSRMINSSISCIIAADPSDTATTATQTQLAILHYAASMEVPQQSVTELRATFDVIRTLAPCNFLVFGLGHESFMWATLNLRGTTIFLEQDARLVHKILARAPALRVETVTYHTRLYEADHLLTTYKHERNCMPPHVRLKGNVRCKLALAELPDYVYNKEWDVIMIDGPSGYFAEAPGRMGTVFTAAVMARERKAEGVTHVILHDVNRKVERLYAEEFLCKKNLVKAVGKLWHFAIPPNQNGSLEEDTESFC